MLKKLSMRLLPLGLALIVAGCGGGGGSPSVPAPTAPATGTGTGTGSTTTPTVAAPSIVAGIYSAGGAKVTNVGLSGSFVARATVLDASGAVVAGRTVQFTLPDTSFATLSPASALTNSAGTAEVSIVPASITAAGATTLTATATVGTATVTGTTDFSISAPSLSLSALTSSSSNLISGGNSTLTVSALIGGAALTAQPANIAFTTTCGRINNIDTTTTASTNGSGVASVTYLAVNGAGDLCSGPVTITATTPGATAVSTNVVVAAPTATAVTFVGASLAQIYVAGVGNVEQSLLTFKVLSSANTPLSNQVANFTLQQPLAGVTLSQISGTTDSSGLVTVTVSSGTVPGPVKVRAALATNATIFAESQNLTVASGPPSQKFMSLSLSKFSLEGASIDGTPTTATVRIADRQGNAVVDGTVVNFTAEGGQIGSSCATATVNNISLCSVNFVTQNPRPANGRISILAYLEGTKDYVDSNGNNRFDAGVDTIVQLGNAYRDDNEDLVYSASNDSFLLTRNAVGVGGCPAPFGAYPSQVDTCVPNALATTVRQQAVILFAASTPVLYAGAPPVTPGVPGVSLSTSSLVFNMGSSGPGLELLPMPAGTLVAVSVVDGTTANNLSCTVADFSGSTVADVGPTSGLPGQNLRTSHAASFTGCATGDSVKVSVTAPGGLITSFLYPFP